MQFRNYKNSFNNSNRIFSEDDVLDMTLRTLFDKENDVLAQNRDIGIPTQEELQSSSNVVWVEEYVRDDGTKVCGHWRSKPENDSEDNSAFQQADLDGEMTGGASDLEQDGIKIQEIDEKLYPEEIAGVKRGKPKTFVEMMQQGVNPRFMANDEEYNDYSTNCQSCVVAAELVIRGYDVEASPYGSAEADKLSKRYNSAYLDPYTGKECSPQIIDKEPKDCYAYIDKTVKQGERYEFSYNITPNKEWKNTESHVVLITRDNNNNLLIYDPQNGETAYGPDDAKLYIDAQLNEHNMEYEPSILRIDDKIPNAFYTGMVVKKHQTH